MTRAGDDELKRQWFRREILPLERQLLGYARLLARTIPVDPEDLVHEVFARTLSADNWPAIDHPLAFARRVLRNLALDEYRRQKVVPINAVADIEDLNTADEQPDPEVTAIGRSELRRLRAIVETLPNQCRRVFVLRKVFDLSPQQIADRLGLSVSTVEKHLTKSLRICSDRLAESPAEPRETMRSRRNWTRNRR